MRRLPAVLIAAASACLLLLTAADGPQARLASATSNGGWGNAHRHSWLPSRAGSGAARYRSPAWRH